MNTRSVASSLCLLLLALLTLSGLICVPPVLAEADKIHEFPLPQRNGSALAITSGPDGNLWFTEFKANKIGRMTTRGSVKSFPVPTPNSRPNEITAGPDGNLWFTELSASQIGRITPSGVVTEFPIPSGETPDDFTSGPDGNVWLSELSAKRIR